MKRLFEVKEMADILRVHPVTIRRWCQSGLLPATRIGKKWLIDPEQVDEEMVRQAFIER